MKGDMRNSEWKLRLRGKEKGGQNMENGGLIRIYSLYVTRILIF